MCKTPKAPKITVPEPQVLKNPFLDDTGSTTSLISSIRAGRSSLRIPLNTTDSLFSAIRNSTSASGGNPTRSPVRGFVAPTFGASDRRKLIKQIEQNTKNIPSTTRVDQYSDDFRGGDR